MQRRSLMVLAGAPLAGWGSPHAAASSKRLGVLADRPPATARQTEAWDDFWGELKRLGWQEGRNLVVERRYVMDDPKAYAGLAAELVAAGVDAIFAPNDPAAAAAQRATRSIPIVMMGLAAVEPGYAASLAHPGGNVTGVVYMALEFIGKEFSLMRSLHPKLKRIGLAGAPSEQVRPAAARSWRDVAAAANVGIVELPELDTPADVAPVLEAAQRARIDALLVGVRPFLLGAGWREILRWAIEQRVSTHSGPWARGEVLVAFGPYAPELRRAAAVQLDQVLKGVNPAGIPIVQPSRFELVLSRKIATAMGLTLPPELLISATEIVD